MARIPFCLLRHLLLVFYLLNQQVLGETYSYDYETVPSGHLDHHVEPEYINVPESVPQKTYQEIVVERPAPRFVQMPQPKYQTEYYVMDQPQPPVRRYSHVRKPFKFQKNVQYEYYRDVQPRSAYGAAMGVFEDNDLC